MLYYLDWEKKSLQATAMAQSELGAPVIIHPGRHPKAPEEIVRILQEAGGDISRTVMSHIDRKKIYIFNSPYDKETSI